MGQQRQASGLEIAVIGMNGRFPGAPDVESLWTMLRDGCEPIVQFSDSDIAAAGNAPYAGRPDFVRQGFVLDGIDMFDASYFGYTRREAEMIDPQQRLFLECASEALERAGYDPDAYPGVIGVFAGSGFSSYLLHNIASNPQLLQRLGALQALLANDKDYVATRVAYKLNLEGPAVTVQTACSTSLVAVHLACQSLLAGDCDMALAGGASVPSRQRTGYLYQEGGIASKDGHCRPFDVDATGTSGGSGIGIVVLKRLADALVDRDSIDAVIIGSAVNNDGARKIGFTAPRVEGQAKAIRAAQQMAGVEPDEISYIEAHGTGTQLGDPIEVAALTRAFRSGTERRQYCAIGSLKSNFGHADSAAGVGGLMKTVLALKHRLIPPSLNFAQPNPQIDFDRSPFYVNGALQEWRSPPGVPRRAGVSSFGLGGTNAHVVVEEAPAIADFIPEMAGEQLLCLSAKTEAALNAATERLADHFRRRPETPLRDVAWTLQVGRKVHPFRRALVCSDPADAEHALDSLEPLRVISAPEAAVQRSVVFLFSGQGTQYVGMTRGLYDRYAGFRQEVDRCCEQLKTCQDRDLRHLLYPAEADTEQASSQLKQTANAQIALFVVEYSLAKLWMSWGIMPQAMIGHSIGEYVAACLAGVMCLEDALRVVAARARAMQSQPAGAMLSVPLAQARLRELLCPDIEIAAVNAPALCVVSGPTARIEAFEREIGQIGHAARRLHTSHAFHSASMAGAADALAAEMARVPLQPPRIPYVSNVTGEWITDEQATSPAYWARHLRETVQFSPGIALLLQDPGRCFLEVGPGNALSTFVQQHLPRGATQTVTPCVRHPQQAASDSSMLLHALARLWVAGVMPDWRAHYGGQTPRRVPLPTYPFERQRYWIESPAQGAETPSLVVPRKAGDASQWLYVPVWKSAPALHPAALKGPALKGRWLVFLDRGGLGEKVAEQIEQRGGEVIRVTAGARFSKRRPGEIVIDGSSRDDYDRLLDGAYPGSLSPDRIVHAGGVGASGETDNGPDLNLPLYSLLYLLQAIGRRWPSPRLRIDLLTDAGYCVTGEECVQPHKAAAPSLCRVLPQEFPTLRWTHVDLDQRDARAPEAHALVQFLMTHLALAEPQRVTAWRSRRRWVLDYERAPQSEGPLCLRERGVYLITGGLGGVGMLLAEYLARQVKARLVLVGRSAFPPRAEWDAWLSAHEESDVVSSKLRRLRAMEAVGSEIMVCEADVADRPGVASVAKELHARFGALHGIIHAAGIVKGPSFGLLRDLGRGDFEEQLRPKAIGLSVIREIFDESSLDFIMPVSSLATVLGGMGMGAYAAANGVMDAFCHARHAEGHEAWRTVDWDAWRLEPQTSESPPEGSTAALALTPAEGQAVFGRVLRAGPLAQIVVSTGALRTRAQQWAAAESIQAPLSSVKRTQLSRPGAARNGPTTGTERAVTSIWEELFGMEQIGSQDGFFALGGHSLMALQILARIREQLGVEVSLAKFMELGTIEKLCRHIDAQSHTSPDGGLAPATAPDRDEISL